MLRYASVVKLSVIAAIAAITLTACATPVPTATPLATATPRPTPTPTSGTPAPKASEVARHSLGPADAPVTVVDVSDFQ